MSQPGQQPPAQFPPRQQPPAQFPPRQQPPGGPEPGQQLSAPVSPREQHPETFPPRQPRSGWRRLLSTELVSAFVGAVIGAAAVLIGGLLATHAQGQQQLDTTRRTVYADFVGVSYEFCTALRAGDAPRTDAALAAFVGRAGAVALVAPDNIVDAAVRINDYLAGHSGLAGGSGPKGCDGRDFDPLINDFIGLTRQELGF